jgi:hypothetical protein
LDGQVDFSWSTGEIKCKGKVSWEISANFPDNDVWTSCLAEGIHGTIFVEFYHENHRQFREGDGV